MLRGNKTAMYRRSLIAVLAGIAFGSNQTLTAQDQTEYAKLPLDAQLQLADSTIETVMSDEEKTSIRDAKAWKNKMQFGITSIWRGSSPGALTNEDHRKLFDEWYQKYEFARLTHPEHMGEWPKKRREFLARMAQMPAAADDVHQHLLTLTRQVMLTIAKGNYHPMARYNAMLFICQLNTKEASFVGDKSPPVPYLQGLADAIQEYGDPKQIDAVRIAALVGMLRHATLDRQLVDQQSALGGLRGQIIGLSLALVNAKEAPAGRTQGGHDWMRRRAVEILGTLGDLGPGGEVVTALQTVLGDDEAPISLRCCAAESLGRLEYPENTTINVADVAKTMGAVAAHVCYDEIGRVEAQQEREQAEREAGVGGSIGMGSPYSRAPGAFGALSPVGGDVNDPLEYRIALTRRRVKARALSVKNGLIGEEKKKTFRFPTFTKPEDGAAKESVEEEEEEKDGILALASTDEDEKYVRKVAQSVGDIIGQADDASFKDLSSLVAEIRKKAKALEEDCGIVVNVDELEGEAKETETLLTNPLEDLGNLGEMPPTDPPSKPADDPTAKTPPKATPETPEKTPAKKTPVTPKKAAPTPQP